jgi:DNA-directed RNA polymerase specialized sigma24 family protein
MGESAVPGSAPGLPQARSRDVLWRRTCAGGGRPAAAAVAEPDTRQALDRVYQAHYRSLVRLAALLTGDARLGEQVTQDSFVAWYRSAGRPCRPDTDQPRLLRQVIARSRQVARDSAGYRDQGEEMVMAFAGLPVVQALTALPRPQREAVVLTLYLGLAEQQAAAAAGVSLAALRRNLSRGVQALGAMPLAQG